MCVCVCTCMCNTPHYIPLHASLPLTGERRQTANLVPRLREPAVQADPQQAHLAAGDALRPDGQLRRPAPRQRPGAHEVHRQAVRHLRSVHRGRPQRPVRVQQPDGGRGQAETQEQQARLRHRHRVWKLLAGQRPRGSQVSVK